MTRGKDAIPLARFIGDADVFLCLRVAIWSDFLSSSFLRREVSALGESWWCRLPCAIYFSPWEPLQQTLYREATNVRRKIYNNNSLTATPQSKFSHERSFLAAADDIALLLVNLCLPCDLYIFFPVRLHSLVQSIFSQLMREKRAKKRGKEKQGHFFPSKKVASPQPNSLHSVNCICLKATEWTFSSETHKLQLYPVDSKVILLTEQSESRLNEWMIVGHN